MAIYYDDSKGGPGEVFPDGAQPPSDGGWSRTAPLITPEQVRTKYLWGLDPVSATTNSLTKRRDVFTDEIIRDKIDDVISNLETETGLIIFPLQFTRKMPFDRHEYMSFGYMRLPNRPVMSIEALDIVFSNDVTSYTIPLDWIETGHLHQGQLNIIPLTIALSRSGAQTPTSTVGASAVLSLLTTQSWVASFWQVRYTAGFPAGQIPKVLNDLIGVCTAMEILSMMAATYARSQSGSLGIDGLSQSVSTPGPKIFADRLQDLGEKRQKLTKKLKTSYGLNFFSGNV